MRLLSFLTICMCLSLAAQSQKKLKYDVDKGDTTYYTNEVKIYNQPGGRNAIGEYLKTKVYKTKNGYMLGFEIQTGRTNVFQIYDGSTCTVTLSDGSSLQLRCLGNHRARNSSMGYGSFIFVFYKLTPADVSALRNGEVTNIQVSASMGTMDYPIKGKFGGTIGDQLNKFQQ